MKMSFGGMKLKKSTVKTSTVFLTNNADDDEASVLSLSYP